MAATIDDLTVATLNRTTASIRESSARLDESNERMQRVCDLLEQLVDLVRAQQSPPSLTLVVDNEGDDA